MPVDERDWIRNAWCGFNVRFVLSRGNAGVLCRFDVQFVLSSTFVFDEVVANCVRRRGNANVLCRFDAQFVLSSTFVFDEVVANCVRRRGEFYASNSDLSCRLNLMTTVILQSLRRLRRQLPLHKGANFAPSPTV